MTERIDIDPSQFAALVRGASEQQLEEGLRTNGPLILDQIFERMAEHLDPTAAADVDAVIEWRIGLPAQAEPSRYQVVIRAGACTIVPGGSGGFLTALSLGGVDFVKLVAGQANPVKLFMFGRLKIEGDLIFAGRMNGLFDIPGG